jgi:hypothetical protein
MRSKAEQVDIVDGTHSVRFPVDVRREIDEEQFNAAKRANRVRSLQFVAQAGMLAASGLTSYEEMLAQEVPGAANRLRAVGDIAVAAIAAEIAGFAR